MNDLIGLILKFVLLKSVSCLIDWGIWWHLCLISRCRLTDSNHETWKLCALRILSQVVQKVHGARESLPETEGSVRDCLVLPHQLCQPLAVHEGPVQPHVIPRHLMEHV